MQFTELENSLKNGVMPIYSIYGKDAFLRDLSLNLIKSAGLSEPDLNLSNFSGGDLLKEVDGFMGAVRSYPFLSEKRYVVVYNYSPTLKEIASKKLNSIFDNPEDTTVIIFVNEKKCEALLKQKNVTAIDCEKADLNFISKYIRNELLPHKIIIGRDAIEKIIEYTSFEMTKIQSEVNKLISYVGENNEITVFDVEKVISKDIEYEIYKLADFIADLKYDKAFSVLNEMLSKNQDKQKLFISIYYHFRRLLHSAISNLNDYELATALGVKEYAVVKARAQAKKFSPVRLKAICDKFALLDSSFKCGDITLDTALWNSIFNILIK